MPIRVVLVDDHTIVRQGVKALLAREPDIQVVDEAADGPTAIAVVRAERPDVVVLDVQLPGLSGPQVASAIRAAWSRTAILVLTMHDHPDYVLAMLQAGARGYLLKESASTDLAAAIRAVHRGQAILHPAVARYVVTQVQETFDHVTGHPLLTPRERDLLRLIALGLTNREIATHLGVSRKTIENYCARLLQKLGARNRVEALRTALQAGLLTAETLADDLAPLYGHGHRPGVALADAGQGEE